MIYDPVLDDLLMISIKNRTRKREKKHLRTFIPQM